MEREIAVRTCKVEELAGNPILQPLGFPAETNFEPLSEADGQIVGILVRERSALQGEVEVTGTRLDDGLVKVTVRIRNTTPFQAAEDTTREDALSAALISTHTVLGIENGGFVSLLAPPEKLSDLAASCRNVGTWPVLVGEEGQCDTLLSSPIILYDYPQIAPESAGDLFDGTEIDEILSLRIMTLTDEEKREMSQSDERAREMLERTEAMPVEHLMKLHGVLRGLRPLKEETR
jgi:hydrogenase maturation protease